MDNSFSSQESSLIYKVLGEHNFQAQKGFFPWWYRLTSPPEPEHATFRQRELVQRGRIASALMLFLAFILLFVGLVAIIGPNKQIANVLYTLYPAIGLCIFLNRRGWVNIVGIVLTLGMIGGMCMTLFTTATHGGLAPNDTYILFLLFFDILFIGTILPVNYTFLAAALNILISIYALSFAPHTRALNAMLPTMYFSMLFRLIQINVIVPAAIWVLVNIGIIAIKRAGRAEELARLQHDIAQRLREEADKQEALEKSIADISRVHAAVANGNLNARVQLTNTNVLWSVAGQLNFLLSRHQRAIEEIKSLQKELLTIKQQEISWMQQSSPSSLQQPSKNPNQIPDPKGFHRR
ncbi:hypothetical protein [Dictyobacter arantiisoli]|uniref:HAMP domain-containing protein n=1 Tax=Dictyobacter arantiisoli TaxID=2014874 RepID=A0A5A5TH43_9CHLR|nr:hypothetical protein [Dictyobacter arantiisoli]GCF10284.1 hypothetical protein KDI_38480 [Dictyobacter arantiisoli]